MTMRKLYFGLILALAYSVGVWQVSVNTAMAQSAKTAKSALAVSPAIIEQVVDPGKPVEFTLKVNNITNFPLPVKSMVRQFTVQSESLEKTEQARLDASQWFTIQDPDFILQPNQVRTVKGTIHAPRDAVPGGHYATIFFQPLIPQEALSPATLSMSSKVGVLALLVMKGDINQKAQYKQGLKTDSVIARGPAQFSFSIQNTGNVHLLPSGKLTIYDWRGQQVAKIDLPLGVILPESTKEYAMEWEAQKAFGKYRAELEVSYGDENIHMSKVSSTFWIVPWGEIIAGVVIGGALLFFVIRTHRRWLRAWRVLRGRTGDGEVRK